MLVRMLAFLLVFFLSRYMDSLSLFLLEVLNILKFTHLCHLCLHIRHNLQGSHGRGSDPFWDEKVVERERHTALIKPF